MQLSINENANFRKNRKSSHNQVMQVLLLPIARIHIFIASGYKSILLIQIQFKSSREFHNEERNDKEDNT